MAKPSKPAVVTADLGYVSPAYHAAVCERFVAEARQRDAMIEALKSGRPPAAQLTLHEVTALTIATCAALGGETADLSDVSLRDLRTAYTKLTAALEVLARSSPPSAKPVTRTTPRAKPRKLKTPAKQKRDENRRQSQSRRRTPKPNPRRIGDR